uniref:Uncharacterized protein n=1 Tax=Oryza brachyantha TaxID=4533 RepID=J3M330_ORYBR
MVKSRMMGDLTYKSTLDCIAKTLKNEARKPFSKTYIAHLLCPHKSFYFLLEM